MKEAPLWWFRYIARHMKDLGFEPLDRDRCILINKSTRVIILIYVDDVCVAALTKEAIAEVR